MNFRKTANLRQLVGLTLLCIVATVSFGVVGCGKGSGDGDSSVRIGMMPKLVGISYFDAAEKGAREAAKELDVELVYDGPVAARNEDQIRMLDGWVAHGMDVVAVAPNDPDGIARTLKSADEVGVTVLSWDTDANPKTSARQVFVNQAENKAIAEAMVDVMVQGQADRGVPLAGKYLIVSGTPTASNQNTWMEFMKKYIDEKYPEIELLPHLTPGEDRQKSQEQTSTALNAHGDLKGIWGITSVALPAAAKAVADANKVDQIYVTGLSLPSLMRDFIHDETVEKFVLWNVVDLGYLTVHVAKELHDGKLKPGRRDFGRLKGIEVRENEVILGLPMIFDKNNVDHFDF
jgi:rhamnose transport system substrate-binding protein